MEVRIGALMVEAGVLTESQVREVLDAQAQSGRPFGMIAEQRFGLDPARVEDAWARQYARITRCVDPTTEVYDDRALTLVTRRQAWQFRILPVRFDGSELMVATTERYLPRALGFVSNVVAVPTYLVVAEPHCLGVALCRQYPLAGMSPLSVMDDGMDRLLRKVA